ncbi:hypothetical protein [Vibrio barjaei]|uniref:hypothetical protein n=1 Tax=Vibrio barjaei TaxID=1676683 RepID=UPI002284F5A8|nr:hypothetical protein [Vibrio barjaei]MCY9870505.1 hypothetical protein [Vibrio barjaei]
MANAIKTEAAASTHTSAIAETRHPVSVGSVIEQVDLAKKVVTIAKHLNPQTHTPSNDIDALYSTDFLYQELEPLITQCSEYGLSELDQLVKQNPHDADFMPLTNQYVRALESEFLESYTLRREQHFDKFYSGLQGSGLDVNYAALRDIYIGWAKGCSQGWKLKFSNGQDFHENFCDASVLSMTADFPHCLAVTLSESHTGQSLRKIFSKIAPLAGFASPLDTIHWYTDCSYTFNPTEHKGITTLAELADSKKGYAEIKEFINTYVDTDFYYDMCAHEEDSEDEKVMIESYLAHNSMYLQEIMDIALAETKSSRLSDCIEKLIDDTYPLRESVPTPPKTLIWLDDDLLSESAERGQFECNETEYELHVPIEVAKETLVSMDYHTNLLFFICSLCEYGRIRSIYKESHWETYEKTTLELKPLF